MKIIVMLIPVLLLSACASVPQQASISDSDIYRRCMSYANNQAHQSGANYSESYQQYFQACMRDIAAARMAFFGQSAPNNNQAFSDIQQGAEKIGKAISRPVYIPPVTNCVSQRGFGNTINTTCTGP